MGNSGPQRTIEIPFGAKTLQCQVPDENLLGIFQPVQTEGKDEILEVKRSLNAPIGLKRLAELARSGMRALIISDDISRKTPVHKIIPCIVDVLNESGVADDRIRVIAVLGTHRPMTPEEIETKFGRDVTERVEVLNHDSRDHRRQTYFGETPSGIPVWVSKSVLEADLRIGIGSIAPHRVSGWSGGAKIVMPGISGEKTVGLTHMESAKYSTRDILGKFENPIRREMEFIARRVGLDMIVNVVLNDDEEILRAVTGDFVKAHREGATYARRFLEVSLPFESDIVIADSHPYDLDFWSSCDKGLCAAELAVREGGIIIYANPCREGLGAGESEGELQELGGLMPAEVLTRVRKGVAKDFTAAATAIMVGQVRQKARIILVSEGLSERESRKLGLESSASLDEAIKRAMRISGSDASIAVLKHAPRLLPTIR